MNLAIPESVSAYFSLSNDAEIAKLAGLFTQDGVVIDEGQTYTGHDAIQSWQREAQKTFEYRVEPVGVSRVGDRLKITAEVVGNFPGSPIQLDHVFGLAEEKIKSLEIG